VPAVEAPKSMPAIGPPWQGGGVAKLTKKAAMQLREHLAAQPPERLVELVMAEVERNPALKDQLLLDVAQAGGPLDLAPYRRSFSDALRSKSAAGGDRSYPRTSGPWARAVHESIARIDALLPAGHAEAVIELTEYALDRVQKAMGTLDDSSGWFAQIITDLEHRHHEACVVAPPDPVALARRLFAFEVDGEWDIFIDSVERYADVLGDEGVAEMRRLAEERWAAVPERQPGSGYDTTPGRFHLERMMEKLAVQAGDVEGRVAVLARDLAHAYDFLQIAEVLAEAGRDDDALEWAQRGLIAFADDPHGPDPRLDDFVLAAYLERGRLDDAADLVWDRFEKRPSAATFTRLRDWAQRANQWAELRPKAFDLLRTDAERTAEEVPTARSTAARRWGTAQPAPAPYRTLIEVLFGDGEVEQAWQLAVEHGCPQPLWMSLARARGAEHPLDAVAVYKREIEDLIDRKQAHGYEQAIAHVVHVGELYARAGAADDFMTYLDDLRHRHKPKTKFMAMLAGALPRI
jgi:tetratricopeptide (TPR) repeat protein